MLIQNLLLVQPYIKILYVNYSTIHHNLGNQKVYQIIYTNNKCHANRK